MQSLNKLYQSCLSHYNSFSTNSTSQLKRNFQNESKPEAQQVFFTTVYIKTSIGCQNQDHRGNYK